jgi:CPA1 family monovalent cation:H+ antiporter
MGAELIIASTGEIQHTTGVYIGLLLLACLVGALAKMFAHVPYTIALVLVGTVVGSTKLFDVDLTKIGFGHDLIFFIILPPLLFHGALHLDLNRLLSHFWPICLFAILGVLISTMVIGSLFAWLTGIEPLLIGLLFGAMISPTDPVSVLAIFKDVGAPDDLKYLVEGESLFNDGTGVVIFTIILGMLGGQGGDFHVGKAVLEFVKVAAGGLVVGGLLGAFAFLLLRHLDDHLLENAICLVLALGSFWVAEQIHVSGVISTVMAGLLIGNHGRRLTMSEKTTETIETFFESLEFIVNSILFILIGLELQTIGLADITNNLRPIFVAIAAMLIGRAVVVYPLYHGSNLAGVVRPSNWSHVLFWGGLRGSIPIALLLHVGLNPEFRVRVEPYYTQLLVACFAIVFFSLVIQGLTMKPLMAALKIKPSSPSEASAH